MAARGRTRQHRRVGVSEQLIREQLTEPDTDGRTGHPPVLLHGHATQYSSTTEVRSQHGASDNSAVFVFMCVLAVRQLRRETGQVLRRV